ncbi:MAG TPA: hypothetical protein VKA86_02780 [Candidatus Krumholzibacteria bacterium]|nr:hypothetical protein [Candidatus Krumholzibacteria bacterium]
MKDVIGRLILAYRRELDLYAEILELARQGAEIVRHCRPLGELNAVNERKQDLLAEIASIDRTIADDKHAWREDSAATASSQGAELDKLLRRLTDRIEQILLAERETDRWIVQGAGVTEAEPETDPNLSAQAMRTTP